VRRPNGGHWAASRVGELLDRGLYHGELAPAKAGRHEALVDDDLWQRVRSLRDAKGALHPRGGRHPREHLLTGGLLVCGRCGQSFYPRRHRNSPGTYRCRGRDGYNGPKTDCGMPPVPKAKVDAAVREIAARVISVEDAAAEVKGPRRPGPQGRQGRRGRSSQVRAPAGQPARGPRRPGHHPRRVRGHAGEVRDRPNRRPRPRRQGQGARARPERQWPRPRRRARRGARDRTE
jgi:hypothetical protein